jgi:hypothetical protein
LSSVLTGLDEAKGDFGRAMNPPDLIPIELALDGVPDVSRSYWVLRGDPSLAGMPFPTSDEVWRALATAAFSNVICLTEERPPYDAASLSVDSFPLEDLVGGHPPADPVQEATIVGQAVRRISQLIRNGKSVVVHCGGGRGRTGTVVGSMLVTLGHDPMLVTQWLDEIHHRRGRPGWPESDWQQAVLEDFRGPG